VPNATAAAYGYAADPASKYQYLSQIYNNPSAMSSLYGQAASVSIPDSSKSHMGYETVNSIPSSNDLALTDSKYGILEKASGLSASALSVGHSAPLGSAYEKSLEQKEMEMKSESPIPQVSSNAINSLNYYTSSGFASSAFQPSGGLSQSSSLLPSQVPAYGAASQYPPVVPETRRAQNIFKYICPGSPHVS